MDSVLLVGLIAVAAVVVVVVYLVVARSRGGSDSGRPPESAPRTSDPSLRQRLSKTRSGFSTSLGGFFSTDQISEELWTELEDALITADVGPAASAEIVQRVRSDHPADGPQARVALVEEIEAMFENKDRSLHIDGSPAVVVVVGVNGSGKTTSIAKIANALMEDGTSVVLGAADTFRAAADVQLREWGDRVGVPVVYGAQGVDPASVAYDAVTVARADGAEVVIVDTAGRLHSQKNLMDELGKVVRVLEREVSTINEVLLVLDGTTGQNGIAQARAFSTAVGVTGVILTKLDGTSRGGIVIAVERELGVPVKFIGTGEGMHDLIPFIPEDFVEALLAS